MSYLVEKFKGKYRLLAPYDINTKQFPRDLNGNYDDSNVYISCHKGIQIFHYGHGILEVYIPSLQVGHNIIKGIYNEFINADNSRMISKDIENKNGQTISKTTIEIINKSIYDQDIQSLNNTSIIFDITESDSEVIFKFNIKYFDDLVKYFNPKTSGASISPFSTKNLPKNKEFKIPDDDLLLYKETTQSVPKEDALRLGQLTTSFIKTLANKTLTLQDIKADMRLQGLRGKDYIYSIGKWNEYLEYIKINI